jgi:hypothetical protein
LWIQFQGRADGNLTPQEQGPLPESAEPAVPAVPSINTIAYVHEPAENLRKICGCRLDLARAKAQWRRSLTARCMINIIINHDTDQLAVICQGQGVNGDVTSVTSQPHALLVNHGSDSAMEEYRLV